VDSAGINFILELVVKGLRQTSADDCDSACWNLSYRPIHVACRIDSNIWRP